MAGLLVLAHTHTPPAGLPHVGKKPPPPSSPRRHSFPGRFTLQRDAQEEVGSFFLTLRSGGFSFGFVHAASWKSGFKGTISAVYVK